MSNIFSTPLKQTYFFRGIHIAIMLSFTIIVQQFFLFPHATWTSFILMMVMVGFDAGAMIDRAYHRFWGTMFALMISYFFWYLGHVNYHFFLFLFTAGVYGLLFFAAAKYRVTTFFTLSLCLVGAGYLDDLGKIPVTLIIIDVFFCTVFAFTISVMFQKIWFDRYKLPLHILHHLQGGWMETIKSMADEMSIKKPDDFYLWQVNAMQKLIEIQKFIDNNHSVLSLHVEEYKLQTFIKVGEELMAQLCNQYCQPLMAKSLDFTRLKQAIIELPLGKMHAY